MVPREPVDRDDFADMLDSAARRVREGRGRFTVEYRKAPPRWQKYTSAFFAISWTAIVAISAPIAGRGHWYFVANAAVRAAMFMIVGTALWRYYTRRGERDL
jgi:hypothetical protein